MKERGVMENRGDKPQRRARSWMPMKVKSIEQVATDTMTFWLVDAVTEKREFDFIAGQYVTFLLDQIKDHEPFIRSYTISSTPDDARGIAITVKRVDHGVVSNYLFDQLKQDDIIKVRGPLGDFYYQPECYKDHLVMVGAGSGVTPFMSMAGYYAGRLGLEGAPQRMTLLMSYRFAADVIGHAEFKALEKMPGVQVYITLTREDRRMEGYLYGRADHEMFARLFDGLYGEASFMTCGPLDFMNGLKNYLLESGVTPDHVKMESFYG
jgi:ferredoxin-NADP reductase